MTARFHAPDALTPGTSVRLSADESHHLSRVLRLRPGDAVQVFNGRGGAFDAVVTEVGRGAATVHLGALRAAAPEPRVHVTLAAAVLKGEGMDAVVRDAVMLGAAAIQPVVTARAEIGLTALARSRRRERWMRIAVASVKQCGRAVLPPVLEPCDFESLVARITDGRLPQPGLLLVEPAAHQGRALPLHALAAPGPPAAATLVVGPEGGWTPGELAQAAGACQFVALGGRTLRADAVPVVALSALFAIWGEL